MTVATNKAMTRPELAFRLAVFVCIGCALPAAVSGGRDEPPLDDPDAGVSVAALRSPESQGSAILELLREAGGAALARKEAFREAAGRLERTAPAETEELLAALGALQVAAPDDFPVFLALFAVAGAEEKVTDAEKEVWRAALPAAIKEAEGATAAVRTADTQLKEALAAVAAAARTSVGMRTALADAEELVDAVETAKTEAKMAALRVAILAFYRKGVVGEILSKYAGAVAAKAPAKYADFLAAVEAADTAAPDAWADFVRVFALFVLAPTEAWR